jgi:hypothetical protein
MTLSNELVGEENLMGQLKAKTQLTAALVHGTTVKDQGD